MPRPPNLQKQKEKQEKLQLQAFQSTVNRVRGDYSFGKIKTVRDMFHSWGWTDTEIKQRSYYPSELDIPIDKNGIWAWLDDRRIEFDTARWLANNPPTLEDDADTVAPALAVVQIPAAVEDPVNALVVQTVEHVDPYHLPDGLPNDKSFMFWFQKKAVKEILDAWLAADFKRAMYLLAGTGTGKTFIIGKLFSILMQMKYHDCMMTPFPYILVTKASVVEQTRRVMANIFGIDCDMDLLVTNYDQLRSKMGELFIKEEIIIRNGEEDIVWKWRRFHPVVLVFDEAHAAKNKSSTQAKIVIQVANIQSPHVRVLFSSATPAATVEEFKYFVLNAGIKFPLYSSTPSPISERNWEVFARLVASPAEPHEHSPAAVGRLREILDNNIVQVKGVKSQFKAINKTEMIDFETKEDREYYEQAYERYLEEKAKLMEGGTVGSTKFAILVEFLKFRQAAELVRARYLARSMWESVIKHGQAAVCACNFKHTITKIVRILIEDYGVERDKISLIWGGAQKDPTKKQQVKKKITENSAVMEALLAEGITLEDLDLDEVEDMPEFAVDIPEEYKLGAQSLKQRQTEIDKFQRGESLYCFFTFRAGGVGLSLHHTDEFTKEKVRRKESGYAVEEDIPKIPTRPRICFLAPTYSAIELVQGLGRCPRLTSLSDTPQVMVFYRSTIEQRVAYIVSIKLRCLGKVAKGQKESWMDVAVKTHVDQEAAMEQHVRQVDNMIAGKDEDQDDSNGMFVEDEEDDE